MGTLNAGAGAARTDGRKEITAAAVPRMRESDGIFCFTDSRGGLDAIAGRLVNEASFKSRDRRSMSEKESRYLYLC